MENELCSGCGKQTYPEKRILVRYPDGEMDYYCFENGCSDIVESLLTEEKQFRTFEKNERLAYLKSLEK